MIPVSEAWAAIAAACRPGASEGVPLSEAAGRVLASEVRSDVDWPPFDTSAMDGYGVRVADLAAGATLAERPGLVAAGDPPPAPIEPGEAVRVMTGAPLPSGTEAVVPVEEARRDRGRITVVSIPRPGEHIRRRGESVASGTTLLSSGRRLDARDIALAALAGVDPVPAFRRPRVSIAVTGNELVPASARPGPGKLRDSNGPMLAALCRERGLGVALHPATPDNGDAVRRLFEEAGSAEDMLVTSGGVSAGDLDLLPAEASRAGFEILFHRVAIRPGKPVAFGRRGDTLWFGLPGNPVSASVCFHLFVGPALERLEGEASPGPHFVAARLEQEVAVRGGRETYRDALLTEAEGESRVAPLPTRGSHDVAAHARANALLRIPAQAARLEAGAVVECLRL